MISFTYLGEDDEKLNMNKPAVQAADADPSRFHSPIGKIYPFIKMVVIFELLMRF